MSDSGSTRQQIFDRIRGATPAAASVSYKTVPRRYLRSGSLSREPKLALMAERLRDYDVDLIACLPHTLTEAIASQVEASGRRRLIVPENFPREWLTSRIDYLVDRHLSVAEVGQVEGVITAAFCGIADSGTIALHHSSTEGRRLLTLLPDWHLIILRASQVVETLPEYFDRCDQPPVLATYISGPSATSDIEMTRVKGVHGPRTLSVVLVEDEIPT